MENAVVTYTHHDLEYIKSKGYDNSWKLNQKRAGYCKYLVCCHSQDARKRNAFLVGLISKVELFEEERYAIYISEYASIDIPDVWKGWRYPVHYTSLEDLGIDISTLKFGKIEQEEKIEMKLKLTDKEMQEVCQISKISTQGLESLLHRLEKLTWGDGLLEFRMQSSVGLLPWMEQLQNLSNRINNRLQKSGIPLGPSLEAYKRHFRLRSLNK